MRWWFPRKRGGPQINLRNDTAVEAPRFRTLPVIAQPPYARWLDGPLQDPDTLAEHLETYSGELGFFPVSNRVGNYRNDDSSLIEPA